MRLDRRTFLKVLGLSGGGLLVAQDVIASSGRPDQRSLPDPLAPASDPIVQVAAALQYDIETIFRFVSDEIRYEPYAGVLRGPLGTLWARAGNAADQALLLAALLDASVVPYRFAIGAIDGSTADALLASTAVDLATARTNVATAWQPVSPSASPSPAPSLAPEVQRRLEDAQRSADAVVAWARQQIDNNVATIQSALEGAGIVPDGGYTGLPDLERQQHAWVQVASGPEWQDLDASLPGATRGQALASAGTTPDTLPDEFRHHVQLAVVAETVSGGGLVQDTILTVEVWADELVGTPIQFLNIRPEGMKAIGVGVAAAIEGKKSYLPALVTGEVAYVGGKPFGFGTGGGVFHASPAPGTPGATEGDAIAQWLQVTIVSPDRGPVVVRRTIFDRFGAAARASGQLDLTALAPVDLVDLGPDLKGEYLPAQTEHWFTVSGGRLAGDGLHSAIRPADDPMAFVDQVHLYHIVRDAADLELGLPDSVRTFLDAPNIVAFSVSPSLDPSGAPLAEFAIDIWHRSYGCLPVAGQPVATTPGVVAGVLSHVAERVLFGDALPAQGRIPDRPLVSVGAVFDAARRDGVGLRVLRGGVVPDDLGYPPDALATLRSTLADGWIVIAPERPVSIAGESRTGWWMVDPATGRTADQMADGRGAAIGEEVVALAFVLVAAAEVLRHQLWLCIIGWALVTAGLLAAMAGGLAGGSGGAVMAGGGAGTGMYGLAACLG